MTQASTTRGETWNKEFKKIQHESEFEKKKTLRKLHQGRPQTLYTSENPTTWEPKEGSYPNQHQGGQV